MPSSGPDVTVSDSTTEVGNGAVGAFFDVDGTLLTVHSGALYASYLRRRGGLTRIDQLRILWAYFNYRIGRLRARQLGDAAARWIAGLDEAEMVRDCAEFYHAEVRELFDPVVLCRLHAHVNAGHTVALLTAGSRYLGELLVADLGLTPDAVIATELEVVDGHFTGRPLGTFCYGKGKVRRAEEFAAEHGVDLDRSYFYSDSGSDLPMLLRVGEPRIVGPDRKLRREAEARGWEILPAAEAPCGPEAT